MDSDPVIFELNDIAANANIEIVENPVVDSKLQNLLQQFNLLEAFQPLIDCGFSFERLQYINQDNLNRIFPEKKSCGLVAELRGKIFKWKTENFPDKPPTTLLANSYVNNWVTSNSSFQNSPKSDSAFCSWSLSEILNSSTTGKTILKFYLDNGCLNKDNRKKLLNVLVEHFHGTNNIKIRTHELEKLADDITVTFPNENKEIYFLSRSETGKSNPSGILFNRFHNINRKKIKLTDSNVAEASEKTSEDDIEQSDNESVESARNKMRFMSGDECESKDIWARPPSVTSRSYTYFGQYL